ncbi:hypothetical protein BGZ98_006404 [Dissophora globulifera]|nr:hypothetical protein BGZ98_006404 [Dissophora globulifera]
MNINVAEHGRMTPAIKDGVQPMLPPKAVELFVHNDKGNVLWFAGPPLDVVPLPRPHHSVEYLAKRQKLQNGSANRKSVSDTGAGVSVANGVHAGMNGDSAVGADEMLPAVIQGLEVLKDQLNRDTQVIHSS